jgi:thiamine transport system substrate-binding protein
MRRTIVIGLVAALLVAACGDDGGGPERVTLLTHSSFPEGTELFAAFTERTGIEVRVLRGEDAGTVTNQAVLDREHPQGDAVYGIDNTFLSTALDAAVFDERAYDTGAVDADLTAGVDPSLAVPIDYGDVCFNYDEDWFVERELDPPATIDDLTRDEYRGLTVIEDPSTSSPGLAFVLATSAVVDDFDDYWAQLAANDVLVVDDWSQAWNSEFSGAGGGDRPIVLSYASSPPADVVFADPPRDDTSIGVIDDACFRQVEYAGVLANAEHSDAAEELVQYLLSPEFQAELPLAMFVFPAVEDVALPDVFERFALRATDPVTLSAREIAERRDRLIDRWTEIVLS